VLVVESMTEAQERALRREVRSWRRPDDEFVYELVVVASGDEALIAARLNVNLQAVVIRRRFSHQSTRDLSTLADFVDTKISVDLDDHKSPDERAQILAMSLAKLRPELDLFLMTQIEVEDIAGRLAGSVGRRGVDERPAEQGGVEVTGGVHVGLFGVNPARDPYGIGAFIGSLASTFLYFQSDANYCDVGIC
jgi:hypothetical protein